MSTVRVSKVQRGKVGELIGVETREIDAAVYAQQEAAKQRAAEIAEARSRAEYERTRDWLVRQIDATMAAVEGRSTGLESFHFVEERQPIGAAQSNLAAIVLNRVSRAIQKEKAGDASEDLFLQSLPAGEKGKLNRAIAGFIDARVGLYWKHLRKREAIAIANRAATRGGVPLGEYRFVWKAGEVYERGDVTTDRGASWICIQPSPDRPGKSATWRLMDKSDLAADRKHKGAVKL